MRRMELPLFLLARLLGNCLVHRMEGSKIHHLLHQSLQGSHRHTGKGGAHNEVCQAQALVVLEPGALVSEEVLVEEGMEEEELVLELVHPKDNHTCHCSTSFLFHTS